MHRGEIPTASDLMAFTRRVLLRNRVFGIATHFDDRIYGDDSNNRIRGYSGADRIYGKAGNDELYGDSGNDYLNGGSGNDLPPTPFAWLHLEPELASGM